VNASRLAASSASVSCAARPAARKTAVLRATMTGIESIQGGYGRRHRVRCGNRVGDVAGEVRGERSGLCDVIERQPLVETLHVHRPFDRHAVAADDERPIVAARDRHHPAVDVRREGAVDPQFLVAGLFSLCQRRIIEKREADRTLDLQCARAGEKH
jgi:hypothetical protein